MCVVDEVFRGQEQGTPASGRTVSAADVVLFGVNIVLPLMSQDLLKVRHSRKLRVQNQLFPDIDILLNISEMQVIAS